jgi:hypothetical protein
LGEQISQLTSQRDLALQSLARAERNLDLLEGLNNLRGLPSARAVAPTAYNMGVIPTLADLDAEMRAANGHPDKVAAVTAKVMQHYGPKNSSKS